MAYTIKEKNPIIHASLAELADSNQYRVLVENSNELY